MELSYKLDERTVLFGHGSWIDESYDDEFGTAKRLGFRLDSFEVRTLIAGESYNVTGVLPTQLVKSWQLQLLEHNEIEPCSI